MPLTISVVTTCFNSSNTIERTLQSVLSQQYSSLEYIVVDACSTDGTTDILRRYDNTISRLIVEKDEGQYHGLRKGLAMASGEVMSWLNADDVYLPWTFASVASIFESLPEVGWIVGLPAYINEHSECIKMSSVRGAAYPQNYIKNGWFRTPYASYLQQESMFWRRALYKSAGGLDTSYGLAADFELWTRFAEHSPLYALEIPVAAFSQTPGQRSQRMIDVYRSEVDTIVGNKPAVNNLYASCCRRFHWFRHIANVLNIRRVKIISYDMNKGWVLKDVLRPVSKYSFWDMIENAS